MDISALSHSMQAPSAAAPTVIPADQNAENRELIQAVKALNGTEMLGQENELLFQRDQQTQRLVVRLVNRKTKEVISQVPPEYVLRLAEDLKHPG